MKRLRQRYIVILGTFLGIVLLLPALLDRPSYQTFDETAGWDVHTPFVANGEPERKEFFPSSILQNPGVRFWTNYSSERGIFTGQVSSSFFVLKDCLMIIPVFGFPNSEEAGVYVESEIDHRRFAIRDGAAPAQWQPATIALPKSLIGTSVRIVAYSRSPQIYIGVGTPYYRSDNPIPGLLFSKLFAVALLSLTYLALLFFPVFYWLPRLEDFAPVERTLATLVVTSLLSVSLFFLAFYAPTAARLVVYLWLLLSGALITRMAIAEPRRTRGRDARCCLIILAGLTAFQALFLFSFNMVSVEYAANYLFYPASWSVDNQIPTTTARLLAHGTILSDWPFGPWRLSDRTPLLGSLLYPAAVITSNFGGYVDGSGESMFLQVCGFGIQNCWILPVWIICRRLRFKGQECVPALFLLAATPFVFFNTVYLWPKILAVTFCLAQYPLLGSLVSAASSSIWFSQARLGRKRCSHGRPRSRGERDSLARYLRGSHIHVLQHEKAGIKRAFDVRKTTNIGTALAAVISLDSRLPPRLIALAVLDKVRAPHLQSVAQIFSNRWLWLRSV